MSLESHAKLKKNVIKIAPIITSYTTADQFDYDAIKDKYDPFLIKMTIEKKDWLLADVDPEEEENLRRMTVGSVAFVIALPLVMAVFIALR